MPSAVIILGAGASTDFGIPTLKGLFRSSQAIQYLTANKWLHDKLIQIFWEPRGVNLKTAEQSLTIEEMLTILEDLQKEAKVPPTLSQEELEMFKRYLYVLIKQSLHKNISTSNANLNPIIDFAESHFDHITWATFNWDCIFEASFYYWSGPYNNPPVRFNPRIVVPLKNWNRSTSKHTFLKLHGGINWWLIGEEIHYLSWSNALGELERKWTEYEKKARPGEQPLILEPSHYKYAHPELYKKLEPQWTEFGSRLVKADYVIVVGYSLPDADSLARSKILTAFQTNPNGRWLLIDPEKEVLQRYGRLIGSKQLIPFDIGLHAFNQNFKENMYRSFPELQKKPDKQSPS